MTGRATSGSTLRDIWRSLWRRPAGSWPQVRWGLSLLLPVAVLTWLLALAFGPKDPAFLVVRVESQVTGETIPDAGLIVGETFYRTDDNGEIRIEPVPEGTEITVSATGYETTRRSIGEPDGDVLTVALPGVLVLGSVSDAISDEPIVGAELTILDSAGTPVASTETDEVGGFVFKLIPEDASLAIGHDVYGDSVHPISPRRSIQVSLDPPPVTGRVIEPDGTAIEGAIVIGRNAESTTDAEGRFVLEDVGQGADLRVAVDGAGEVTLAVEGTDLGDIVVDADGATPEGGE